MLRYEAQFIDRNGRLLYVLARRPAGPVKATVVVAPAFAEEMNRCRRMLSILAETLGSAGIALVLVDLSGTGDSDGDFRDCCWPSWLDDLQAAIDWTAKRMPAPIHLLGIRAGALLAAEVAKLDVRITSLIFWQPVTNGAVYAKQFLRLKLAADMMARKGGSITDVRDALISSGSLEIAGYELTDELLKALESAVLSPPSRRLLVHWFELVSADGDVSLSRSGRQQADSWMQAGAEVRVAAVPGEKFWATQEITTCPALAILTTDAIATANNES